MPRIGGPGYTQSRRSQVYHRQRETQGSGRGIPYWGRIEPTIQAIWDVLHTRKAILALRKLVEEEYGFSTPSRKKFRPPKSPVPYVFWLLEEAATETAIRHQVEGEGRDSPATRQWCYKTHRNLCRSVGQSVSLVRKLLSSLKSCKTAAAKLILFHWEEKTVDLDHWEQILKEDPSNKNPLSLLIHSKRVGGGDRLTPG